jgi:hypothetical protein
MSRTFKLAGQKVIIAKRNQQFFLIPSGCVVQEGVRRTEQQIFTLPGVKPLPETPLLLLWRYPQTGFQRPISSWTIQTSS